ncbi:family 20 glycosylhydrolase [Streptomyces sp. NPDC057579]|uniref:family 20 glycosylhydrolase n=1 Tax=Streptomyces sp. NPDC057579 TaxID=3346172 RepID=UPI003698A6A8
MPTGPVTPMIPNVQHFEAAMAGWAPTRDTCLVVGSQASAATQETAATLASELVTEGWMHVPPPIVEQRKGPADIALTVAPVPEVTHTEGYRLHVADGLHATGVDETGLFYATRTLLQTLRTQQGRYSGIITDWPVHGYRGVMLDIGRKHFTPAWIEQFIRNMSYVKLNELQLHIAENTGFRIQSDTHPEVVSKRHLTKAQVREILATARRYHVDVVPSVDTPSHAKQLLATHPEWQLKLTNGRILPDKVDYSIPAAREFVKDILGEMCDLFEASSRFQLGSDEFFPYPWENSPVTPQSAPQLVAYAHEVGGTTIYDGFHAYLNELGDVVRAKGKIAAVWNDDINPDNQALPLNKSTEIYIWIRWNQTKPTATDYVDAGYPVLNANGDYLYFIVNTDGSCCTQHPDPKKSPQGIYDRWTPRTFMGAAGGAGDHILPEGKPMLGAQVEIWCDNPKVLDETEIAEKFVPWMRTFAQQVWGSPKIAPTYDAGFLEISDAVGDAPADAIRQRPWQ